MQMITIDEIRKRYQELDATCGVDTSAIEIEFSIRMKRKHGLCRYEHNKPVLIRIASFLQAEPEQLWDTALHEYAHALVKLREPHADHHHDSVWQAACKEIGCRSKRCAPNRDEYMAHIQEVAKYVIQCENCGREWYRMRSRGPVAELLKNPNTKRYRCNCGSNHFKLEVRH